LVQQDDGGAAEVFRSLGVKLDQLRGITIETLSQQAGPRPSTREAAETAAAATRQAGRSTEPINVDRSKFTDQVRQVLTLAQEEAIRFNHNYVGTEHLILGLARVRDCGAARVLADLGVDVNRLRDAIEFIIGRGDRPTVGEIGRTPRAKKVMELAVDEARRLGHSAIGTEHVLLGLMREGGGIAFGVLESLGVNLEAAQLQIMQQLHQKGPEAGAPARTWPPAVPPEASALVGPEEHAQVCSQCAARSPLYFRYCFNCGTEFKPA
jgi:hypothetical protein